MQMQTQGRASSARQLELLERAYDYVLQHGLTSLSLRPLAQAIGSSPRVLLFLFGSKEGLLRRFRTQDRGRLAGIAGHPATRPASAFTGGCYRTIAGVGGPARRSAGSSRNGRRGTHDGDRRGASEDNSARCVRGGCSAQVTSSRVPPTRIRTRYWPAARGIGGSSDR